MKKLAVLLLVLSGLFAGGDFCFPVIVRGVQVWHIGRCYDPGTLVTYIEVDPDGNIKERAWDRLLVVYNEIPESLSLDMTRLIVSDKAPEQYRDLAWKTIESRIRGNVGNDAVRLLNWSKKIDWRTNIAWAAYGSKLSVRELQEIFHYSCTHSGSLSIYAARDLCAKDKTAMSKLVREEICVYDTGTSWTEALGAVWAEHKNCMTNKDLKAFVGRIGGTYSEDAEQILAKRKADREAAKQAAKKPKLGLAVREDDARLR